MIMGNDQRKREREPFAGASSLVCLLCTLIAGCSAEAIRVVDSEFSDDATHAWLFGSSTEPKTAFTTEDEKVTFSVRFGLNYVATYFVYEVEWVAPGGRMFLRAPIRTQWGTHRVLITALAIRGAPAARLPGQWQVRLYLKGRELVERSFQLAGAPATLPPDAFIDYYCPPANRPPGECIDRLPEE